MTTCIALIAVELAVMLSLLVGIDGRVTTRNAMSMLLACTAALCAVLI